MQAIEMIIIGVAAFFAPLFVIFSPTVVFTAPPWAPVPRAHAEVLFGGDMMFDRSIRIAADREGQDFILSCLKPLLEEPDLVVANLEGPITAEPSVSVTSQVGDSNNFTFTFPEATGELLARHNIRLVNLGNNHILNFGTKGEESTTGVLKAASVGYFGDTATQRVATTTLNRVPLAFVNYNQFSNTSTRARTIEQITAARSAGYLVVVYTHWGDEYLPANEQQKMLAHDFIDAGAEIVIGSHPHVIQEHEIYRGKHIYYSLGNLVFDQYWNDEVRRGLLVSVTFTRDGVVSIAEREIMLERDRRTCPVGAS